MVKLIVGTKGTGKTKSLVSMANAAGEASKGNVVFVEKGMQLQYDLSAQVRLVNTEEFSVEGFDKLTGFLSGILAGNYDITHLFVDGTFKIGGTCQKGLESLVNTMAKVAPQETEIVMSISCDESELAESIKGYVLK